MLTKTKLALALLVSLVTGGVALAHGNGGGDGGPRKAEILAKYDTNKDGKLDDTERAVMKKDFEAKRAAMKAKMLAKYDTNKDGKLEPAERAAMQEERAAERFKKLDKDGDGKLSLDEFKAGRQGREGRGFHRGHHGQHQRGEK